MELSKALLECPEGRAEKRKRTSVGGAIPEDADKFVTPAIQQVRDKAAKRRDQKGVRVPWGKQNEDTEECPPVVGSRPWRKSPACVRWRPTWWRACTDSTQRSPPIQ